MSNGIWSWRLYTAYAFAYSVFCNVEERLMELGASAYVYVYGARTCDAAVKPYASNFTPLMHLHNQLFSGSLCNFFMWHEFSTGAISRVAQ